jgi:hypothetical protein
MVFKNFFCCFIDKVSSFLVKVHGMRESSKVSICSHSTRHYVFVLVIIGHRGKAEISVSLEVMLVVCIDLVVLLNERVVHFLPLSKSKDTGNKDSRLIRLHKAWSDGSND